MNERFGSVATFLRTLWKWLTEPAVAVQDDAQRRRARLLSALLAPLIVGTLLAVLSTQDEALALAIALVVLVVLYGLSRTRYHVLAAVLSIGVLSAPSFVLIATDTDHSTAAIYVRLLWLVLPILLSSLVLPLAGTVIVAVANFVGILLLAALVEGIVFSAITGPLGLMANVSILVVLAAAIRRDYLEQLQQQLVKRGEIEKSLRKSEQTARALLNAPSGTAFLVDPDGVILALNETVARTMGRGKDLDEMVGLNVFKLFPPDVAANRKVQRDKVLQTREPVRFEDEREGRWYATSLYPVFDDNDEIVQLAVFARDITERKQAEETKREQRAFIEALRDTAALLNSTLELDEVLNRILANVQRVVPHDTADIMLVNGDMLRMIPGKGYAERGLTDWASDLHLPLADFAYLHEIVKTGNLHPIIVPDTRTDPHWIDIEQTRWIRSWVCAPIGTKGHVLGFLNVDSATPQFFTSEHAERLQAFANEAGIAIQNAHLYERAQELAAVEERQRLARDLHDAVSQTLFSASVIAEMLPRIWKRNPDEAGNGLRQLHQLTRGALAEMRTLLLELRPAVLVEARLGDLFRQLAEATMGRTGIDVALEVEGDCQLPSEVQVNVYRIAQEALNNIIKHARATEITMSLDYLPQRVKLFISDNGRGFDKASVQAERMGLNIMRERAEAIVAQLEITSAKEQGTSVNFTWNGN